MQRGPLGCLVQALILVRLKSNVWHYHGNFLQSSVDQSPAASWKQVIYSKSRGWIPAHAQNVSITSTRTLFSTPHTRSQYTTHHHGFVFLFCFYFFFKDTRSIPCGCLECLCLSPGRRLMTESEKEWQWDRLTEQTMVFVYLLFVRLFICLLTCEVCYNCGLACCGVSACRQVAVICCCCSSFFFDFPEFSRVLAAWCCAPTVVGCHKKESHRRQEELWQILFSFLKTAIGFEMLNGSFYSICPKCVGTSRWFSIFILSFFSFFVSFFTSMFLFDFYFFSCYSGDWF